MSAIHLLITTPDGEQRVHRTEEHILSIGLAPGNALTLDRGEKIAPRHAQLIAAPDGYRLVNLSDGDILLHTPAGERPIPPHTAARLTGAEEIHLGGYTLTLIAEAQPTAKGQAIGLNLHLPRRVLAPDHPIEGHITVRNQGDRPGAQFALEVRGLKPTCYDLGPAPILYPNAEQDIFFRLHHPRNADLPAGQHHFQIIATAPGAYPDQRAVVSAAITVLPIYTYELEILLEEAR